MTMPQSDHTRLAHLRQQWREHPDRRADIEAEAAEIAALHVIRSVFPHAEVLNGAEGKQT